MSYLLKGMRERRGELMARSDAILHDPNLNDEGRAEFDSLVAEVELLDPEIEKLAHEEKMTGLSLVTPAFASLMPGTQLTVAEQNRRDAAAKPPQFQDQHGRPVYMLGRGQRWTDLPIARKDPRLAGVSVGDIVRASITGKSTPEIRAAMSEGNNLTGGVLVPDELAASLIDKARSASVVMRAGAQTVPMSSDLLRMARVASDPTVEHKAENVAFTGSDFNFDSITFTSHTLGVLLTASRELAEDAPNFATEVEAALAAAFATKLDNIAINGFTSTSMAGILNWPTTGVGPIGETGSIGAIAWEDLHTAAVGIQLANFQANAYIINPDIAGDLATLLTGDGTNAAKGWLPPPSTVAPLLALPTTNISTASIIVGDFTNFFWGIRQGVLIETTKDAGGAFEKHQFLIKLTWRGDCNATHRDAFWRLVGVTT